MAGRGPRQALSKALHRFARTRFGGWFAVKIATPVDRVLLHATRGRLSLFVGEPVGMLHVRGARSGEMRTTPLLYLKDGSRFVLVASKAGSPKHPSWYHNLRANPDVTFVAAGAEQRCIARVADAQERDELWPRVNALYAGYSDYQLRAGDRTIPVVVLDPAP